MDTETAVFVTIISIAVVVAVAVIFGAWYLVRSIKENRKQRKEMQILTSEIDLPILD